MLHRFLDRAGLDVRSENVDLKRLGVVLAVAYQREFHYFASLLLLEKLGPRTLQSLALVAEVVHGTPTRFSDPARSSFAHGGKDGHPFPVPLKIYDETIQVLRRSLEASKVGDTDKIDGLRRLDRFVRAVEGSKAPSAGFNETIARERHISSSLGGRTATKSRRTAEQLSLFFSLSIGRHSRNPHRKDCERSAEVSWDRFAICSIFSERN